VPDLRDVFLIDFLEVLITKSRIKSEYSKDMNNYYYLI